MKKIVFTVVCVTMLCIGSYGYKLWLNQIDTGNNIRFMIEGSWPDKAVYNTIHNNELYKDAIKDLTNLVGNLKVVSYNRFTWLSDRF